MQLCNYKLYKLFYYSLFIFFIGDFANKVLLYAFGIDGGGISIIPRALFEVFLLYFFFSYINYRKQVLLIIFLFFLSITFIGMLFMLLGGQLDSKFSVLTQFVLLNKIYLVFIIFIMLKELNEQFLMKLTNTFSLIVIANAVCIFIGFIFDLKVFSSYGESGRFGYSGIIMAVNEASYFIILGLSFFYYKFKYSNSKFINFQFLFVLFTALLSGTKAVYIFIISLYIFDFFYFFNIRKVVLNLIIIFLVMFVFLEQIQTFLSSLFEFLMYFYYKDGLVAMLISHRNILFEERFLYYEKAWTSLNYFLGGSDISTINFEMDIVDSYIVFGVFAFIYYYMYFKYLVKKTNVFGKFVLIILLLLGQVGGHFMMSAINGLYIALFALLMKKYKMKILKESK